jgi:hypothetical protein
MIRTGMEMRRIIISYPLVVEPCGKNIQLRREISRAGDGMSPQQHKSLLLSLLLEMHREAGQSDRLAAILMYFDWKNERRCRHR